MHIKDKDSIAKIIETLISGEIETVKALDKAIKKYPKVNGGYFSRREVMDGIKGNGTKVNEQIMKMLIKKPVRSLSGVVVVTVLTKPFPCPGKCIFCPSDVRMPKSYIASEPGAQRALRNQFDPYLQTYNRIEALARNGHSVDKLELIVLGGTWSFYPEDYQIWFIKRCFEAMNDFGDDVDNRHLAQNKVDMSKLKQKIDGEKLKKRYNQVISEYLVKEYGGLENKLELASWIQLEREHKRNENSNCRCVGLVLETRPDNVDEAEVVRMRRLGATKTQIGYQSLNDKVLELNHRGHGVKATKKAMELLRLAGFKIHAHWMPNLYGSSVTADKIDYKKIFDDVDLRPDELKIYPCSLIETAELMQYYHKKLWQPYQKEELLELLAFALVNTPRYVRLTRIIRDIPASEIVVGNKMTNFRQLVEKMLLNKKQKLLEIRSREIRDKKTNDSKTIFIGTVYETAVSIEHFLEFTDENDHILGFLRLSLPKKDPFMTELISAAIIREVHVYGPVAGIGTNDRNKTQHIGLGKTLINRAQVLSLNAGYKKMAVISAVGTRGYYRKLGFVDGELYLIKDLGSTIL